MVSGHVRLIVAAAGLVTSRAGRAVSRGVIPATHSPGLFTHFRRPLAAPVGACFSWEPVRHLSLKDTGKGRLATTRSFAPGIRRLPNWYDMDNETRELWGRLGWSHFNWSSGRNVWSEKLDWDELDEDSRNVAVELGYNERSWNGEDRSWKEKGLDKSQAVGVLMVLALFGAIAAVEKMLEEMRWRRIGVTAADRDAVKDYIVSTAMHSDHDLSRHGIEGYEVRSGADQFLEQLRVLFVKLSHGQPTITLSSWLQQTGNRDGLGPRDPSDLYSMVAGEPALMGDGLTDVEWNVAAVLFQAVDLKHSESLTFTQFATLAVMVASATTGDRDSKLELLFMIMDKDNTGFLSWVDVDTFVRLAESSGLLPVGSESGSMWARGDQDGDGVISREEFFAGIGPALQDQLDRTPKGRSALAAGQDVIPEAQRDFNMLMKRYRAHYYRDNDRDERRHHGNHPAHGREYTRPEDESEGSGGGCFAAGTQVVMKDGSSRPIESLALGDATAGGIVTATMAFQGASAAPVRDYCGVVVAGDHAVLNEDGRFVRVENSRLARAGPQQPSVVYDIITTDHRIHCLGRNGQMVTFADYIEVDYADYGHDIDAIFLERLNARHGETTRRTRVVD